MVEGVECLEAELGSHGFLEDPVLLERRVPVLIAGTAKIGEKARRCAESAVRRILKRSRVKPFVDGAI